MKISKALTQAYTLQDVAYKAVIALTEPGAEPLDNAARERRAAALAQLIRSWDTCVDRARIIRRVPLPGSLRPKPHRPRHRSTRPLIVDTDTLDTTSEADPTVP